MQWKSKCGGARDDAEAEATIAQARRDRGEGNIPRLVGSGNKPEGEESTIRNEYKLTESRKGGRSGRGEGGGGEEGSLLPGRMADGGEMGDVTDDGLTSFLPFLAGGTSPGFPRGSARLPPSSLTPPVFDLHIDLLISSHSKYDVFSTSYSYFPSACSQNTESDLSSQLPALISTMISQNLNYTREVKWPSRQLKPSLNALNQSTT